MVRAASDRQAPLVSIICRSMGRPELKQALASAAAQTHVPLEIVLVDAAALGAAAYRQACADHPLRLVAPGVPLSRPRAANLGLEQARGDYLLFLDEDDWLAPDHIEHLLASLLSQTDLRAVYSSTRKTDAAAAAAVETFSQPFDRTLLLRDNYIPIHSMLFSRCLVQDGCRFDEKFEIFEDWDFWLQLSEHTDFLHIDRPSAFYRSGGASQTADLDHHLQRFDPDHQLGKVRSAIYDKWLRRWNGGQLNRLLGLERGELEQAVNRSGELGRKLERLALAKQKVEQQAVEARNAHVRMEMRLNAAIAELQRRNVQLHGAAAQYRARIEAIHQSRSWKMTRPYRALGEWIKYRGAGPPAEQTIQLDGEPAPAPPPQATEPFERRDSGDVKAEFDRKAKAAMEAFFAGGEKLAVPVAEQPLLSILLVFHNQAHLSLLCLRALLEHADMAFELIIVDNASTDRTGELLGRMANVKLIQNSENLGFVRAVNQGAAVATGEFLLLLNNDAFIEAGALGAALAVLREDAGVGAVGGRIELLDGGLQEAGNIIWRDGSCVGYGRGADPADSAFQFRRDVDYCSGAFLLFRARHFRELDGFDEDFAPAYYEESDFCLRLRRLGLRTVYEPRARLRHYEFASGGGMGAAVALQEKNRALFCAKHSTFLQSRPAPNPERIIHARTANGHPNLLVIDDAVPHGSLGGGYPRCRSIIDRLARMPLNISFLPLHFPDDDWSEVYRTLPANVEVLLGRGRSGLVGLLSERTGFYDHVMVSRPTNMAFFNEVLESLPEQARRFQVVYDAEAVFAGRELLWRELQGERVPEEEKKRVLAAELDLAAEASTVVTVSETEAELFRAHDPGRSHGRVVVLGHGMKPAPELPPFDNRRGLLFVGALKDEHSPNVDSLLWFVCNVLPLMERELADIELLVAGNAAAPSLVSIELSNVQLKGRLDSLDPLYRECRVFIAPTRFAAGIPHKVHEAAAHGIPAVVTPLLATQLGWRDEQEVLVGDTPEKFAAQCVRLHRDADLWERLSANARAAVARDCDPKKFHATLKQLFVQ